MTKPFWKTKTLAEMTRAEWESLCDGCGRCCLNKLEEEITNRLYFTDVGCRLLDPDTCRCRDYKNRHRVVEDCVQLTPKNISSIDWLPPSCGYRLVNEGKDLRRPAVWAAIRPATPDLTARTLHVRQLQRQPHGRGPGRSS